MGSAGAKTGSGTGSLWGSVADGIEGVGKGVSMLKTLASMAGLGLAQAFAKGAGGN